MTYVDNGPAWWTLLLLAIGGGLIALLAHNGAKELAGWWVAWRRQYEARHRADPIEDATDDIPDSRFPSGEAARVLVVPEPITEDEADQILRAAEQLEDNENDPMYKSWATPLGWAANGRYVHRADCPHMTTGKPITVWSEQAARNWAEATSPRLTACPHCKPFDTPEPAETS